MRRRLVAAQLVVLAVMVVTLGLVAALVAPPVFTQHLREAGHGEQPMVLDHAQEAFRAAGLTAAAVGLVVAALATWLVSSLVMGRIGRNLAALAAGARRVASGNYAEPVVVADAGPEIDEVAEAFNDMARQISSTEATRRRLLTDVSHELRTPIAAIDVTLEALEDGIVALDAATLATLRAQTARLTRLAVDIRDVSAAEEGRLELQPRRVLLSDLVGDAVTANGVAMGPLPEGEVLEVDPARISQVLDNLIRNALQHSPPGGRVEVGAERRRDSVLITVADQGAGISAEDLAHIFERFYSSHEGMGVGLTISRSIARAHGGDLTAASPGVGQGAVFTLTLPASRS